MLATCAWLLCAAGEGGQLRQHLLSLLGDCIHAAQAAISRRGHQLPFKHHADVCATM